MSNKKRKTEFQTPSPKDWGLICQIVWKPQARIIIGTLFANNGLWPLDEPYMGDWKEIELVNHQLAKYNLPYRVKSHEVISGVHAYTVRQQLRLSKISSSSTRNS
jgi:hypothetical protein